MLNAEHQPECLRGAKPPGGNANPKLGNAILERRLTDSYFTVRWFRKLIKSENPSRKSEKTEACQRAKFPSVFSSLVARGEESFVRKHMAHVDKI